MLDRVVRHTEHDGDRRRCILGRECCGEASGRDDYRDLRANQLGRKFGSPLPVPKLREFIDGRGMVRAHGTSGMPVWGEKLTDGAPASPNAEFFGRGTILTILDYIESLQAR